jgi:hypothetical protein
MPNMTESSTTVEPTPGNTFNPLSRASVSNWVRANADAINAAAGTLPATFPAGPMHVGGSSTKIEAGDALGVTSVVYGAPHSSAFASPKDGTTCENSTPECRAACLGTTAGRMVMRPVAESRLWKTTLRRGAPAAFQALLLLDIAANHRRAVKEGKPAYFRGDGTTDHGDAERIARAGLAEGTTLYDYTKDVARAFRSLEVDGYHVTLSYTGRNLADCLAYLAAGGNVAVVTDLAKGDAKPDTFHGFPTVDGDAHDLRPIDGAGTVALLTWKGPRANIDTAGPFVHRCR